MLRLIIPARHPGLTSPTCWHLTPPVLPFPWHGEGRQGWSFLVFGWLGIQPEVQLLEKGLGSSFQSSTYENLSPEGAGVVWGLGPWEQLCLSLAPAAFPAGSCTWASPGMHKATSVLQMRLLLMGR